jgi:hypothetical protein
MSDNTRELDTQLRNAQSKIRATESELVDVKRHRIRWSVWSAVAGLMVFAIGGHWFPGYQLDSTAKAASNEHAAKAVSMVMSELCAERFMRASGFESRLTGLKDAAGDWSKANYIRDGAWAKTPDGEKSDHATAEKCAVLIAERISAEPEKTS